MTREWYAYGDDLYEKYVERVRRIFRRSKLTLNFDEINAKGCRKEAQRVYELLRKLNRRCFDAILEYVYFAVLAEAGIDASGRAPGKQVLNAILSGYNPVTKYVYGHETERKQSRFFEALVSDVEARNRRGLDEDYKAAERLWLRMTQQYFIDVEDAAAIQAYKDAGVKRVKWVTEFDDRVCGVCDKLRGKVFPIDSTPAKPHYNCRCWLTPADGRNAWR